MHVGDPPAEAPGAILALQRAAGNAAVTAWLQASHGAPGSTPPPRSSITVQRSFVDLKQRADVYYADPPMDEAAGRLRMAGIQNNDALAGLLSRAAAIDKEFHVEGRLSFEWGLAKDRNSSEVILVVGAGGSVNWGPFLDDAVPIAHRHPWLKGQRVRGVKGFDSPGAVLLKDLVKPRAAQGSPQELSLGRMMVLPSVGDIRFTAERDIERHTVFTPYFCFREAGQEYVADPHSSVVPRLRQQGVVKLGFLSFELIHPHRIGSSENFGSMIEIRGGGERLWMGYAIAREDQAATSPPDLDPGPQYSGMVVPFKALKKPVPSSSS